MLATDGFDQWLKTLSEKDQGRIVGTIDTLFNALRCEIVEPYGRLEQDSRHSPNVYVLYPVSSGKTYVVFCFLTESEIYLVSGFDPNVWLDYGAKLQEADRITDGLLGR